MDIDQKYSWELFKTVRGTVLFFLDCIAFYVIIRKHLNFSEVCKIQTVKRLAITLEKPLYTRHLPFEAQVSYG